MENLSINDSQSKPFEQNNKWGFCSKDKKIIIECKYDWAEPLYNGLATVLLNGKWGCIDSNDNIIIPFEYKFPVRFSSGLAAVAK